MAETDRVILGENCIYSSDCEETGINNNILVVGCTGCGKTMSITEPRLLETVNSCLVVTVTKRRLIGKYAPLFQRRGYNVWDLNFTNPTSSSISYDPLAYVSTYADITFLAESIVKAGPQRSNTTSDPYWNRASTSLLSAEIAYILMTKRQPTFSDVLNLHNSIDFKEEHGLIKTSLDEKFRRLGLKYPNSFAISCWKSFQKLPPITAGCVFSTLNSTIDTVFTPELREMMSTGTYVSFEQLATEKTVLFISTSAVNHALNCFVNIFYSQMFKQLFEFAEGRADGIVPIPVHVICDDFATGSPILNFAEYISIFREKQISVTLLLQSESQLEAMYGADEAATIKNNCDSYVYLGGNDLRSVKEISERLNTTVDQVLYMPVGQEIIFRRGRRPVISNRYNIRANRLYQKLTQMYEKNNSYRCGLAHF